MVSTINFVGMLWKLNSCLYIARGNR